jgi:hypothetical protein
MKERNGGITKEKIKNRYGKEKRKTRYEFK